MDYPTVVVLEYYRNFDLFIYEYQNKNPDSKIEIISKRAPYVVLIDGQQYIFVSYDTYPRWCKGRTYYKINGNLYHSGYLWKEKEK